MDNELKIIISGTLRTLHNIPANDRTWEAIMEAVMQNPLLETTPPDEITRTRSLIKEGQKYFKFDRSPDPAIVEEVEAWFAKLTSDYEILKTTQIDPVVVAKIIGQTGATVTGFMSAFKKEEYHHERVSTDIGVLRFPEPSYPSIMLYRIQLNAWSYCNRVLADHEYRKGVTGVFHSCKFRPHKSVIDRISPVILKKAIKDAEDLFK